METVNNNDPIALYAPDYVEKMSEKTQRSQYYDDSEIPLSYLQTYKLLESPLGKMAENLAMLREIKKIQLVLEKEKLRKEKRPQNIWVLNNFYSDTNFIEHEGKLKPIVSQPQPYGNILQRNISQTFTPSPAKIPYKPINIETNQFPSFVASSTLKNPTNILQNPQSSFIDVSSLKGSQILPNYQDKNNPFPPSAVSPTFEKPINILQNPQGNIIDVSSPTESSQILPNYQGKNNPFLPSAVPPTSENPTNVLQNPRGSFIDAGSLESSKILPIYQNENNLLPAFPHIGTPFVEEEPSSIKTKPNEFAMDANLTPQETKFTAKILNNPLLFVPVNTALSSSTTPDVLDQLSQAINLNLLKVRNEQNNIYDPKTKMLINLNEVMQSIQDMEMNNPVTSQTLQKTGNLVMEKLCPKPPPFSSEKKKETYDDDLTTSSICDPEGIRMINKQFTEQLIKLSPLLKHVSVYEDDMDIEESTSESDQSYPRLEDLPKKQIKDFYSIISSIKQNMDLFKKETEEENIAKLETNIMNLKLKFVQQAKEFSFLPSLKGKINVTGSAIQNYGNADLTTKLPSLKSNVMGASAIRKLVMKTPDSKSFFDIEAKDPDVKEHLQKFLELMQNQDDAFLEILKNYSSSPSSPLIRPDQDFYNKVVMYLLPGVLLSNNVEPYSVMNIKKQLEKTVYSEAKTFRVILLITELYKKPKLENPKITLHFEEKTLWYQSFYIEYSLLGLYGQIAIAYETTQTEHMQHQRHNCRYLYIENDEVILYLLIHFTDLKEYYQFLDNLMDKKNNNETITPQVVEDILNKIPIDERTIKIDSVCFIRSNKKWEISCDVSDFFFFDTEQYQIIACKPRSTKKIMELSPPLGDDLKYNTICLFTPWKDYNSALKLEATNEIKTTLYSQFIRNFQASFTDISWKMLINGMQSKDHAKDKAIYCLCLNFLNVSSPISS